MNTPHLSAKNLECVRNQRLLFTDLNFSLSGGEGMLVTGANGSGKTSLLRMIAGLLTPTAGEIYWCGERLQDCAQTYRAELSYIGHKNAIKNALTVAENLHWISASQQNKKLDKTSALQQFNLHEHAHVFGQNLSAGQRQRLALARLSLMQSRLWILDEPFTAIDKAGIQLMESSLRKHLSKNGMVILTSHQPVHLDGLNIKHFPLS